MALNLNRIWLLSIIIAVGIQSTMGKISKTTLHERTKMENSPLRLEKILKERRLLGRFSGSKLIRKSKLAFKKVKNLKNGFGLPPGRKLAAVYTKKVSTGHKAAKINLNNLNVERQLRKKGKFL
jgi:hypothetical protein